MAVPAGGSALAVALASGLTSTDTTYTTLRTHSCRGGVVRGVQTRWQRWVPPGRTALATSMTSTPCTVSLWWRCLAQHAAVAAHMGAPAAAGRKVCTAQRPATCCTQRRALRTTHLQLALPQGVLRSQHCAVGPIEEVHMGAACQLRELGLHHCPEVAERLLHVGEAVGAGGGAVAAVERAEHNLRAVGGGGRGGCGLAHVGWLMWAGSCGLAHVGWLMWAGSCGLAHVGWLMWAGSCGSCGCAV
jgi:hypothetical protein